MRPNRPLGLVLILTALVTAAYWANYFTGGEVKTADARWYTAFEDAFPIADGWLAATALLAGIGCWQRRRWAPGACLLAGSALLYLAAMDITFDLENGLYKLIPGSAPMDFELTINLWSLALGIWAAAAGWRAQNAAQT